MSKSFRIRSKNLYLTYSQLPSLTITDSEYEKLILRALIDILGYIENYFVKIEKHEDGNLHVHCWLNNNKAFGVYSSSKLDIDLNKYIYTNVDKETLLQRPDKGIIHGNYQSGINKFNIISYMLKDININDKKVVENLVCTFTPQEMISFLYATPKDHILDVLRTKGLVECERVLLNLYPELLLNQGHKLIKNLKIINDLIEREKIDNNVSVKDLNTFEISDKIEKWVESVISNKMTTALLLIGKSGTGKTELAKAIIKHMLHRKIVFVSDINALRDKNLENNKCICILFDDISIDNLTRESTIHLVDTENYRDIRVLYGVVNIKPNTPKIFTSNLANFLNHKLDNAIKRRTTVVEIENMVFGTTEFVNFEEIEVVDPFDFLKNSDSRKD